MKKVVAVLMLLFLLVLLPHIKGKRFSSPAKPSLIRCRSPEKETFTCWWEPGSDGGLPTTFALYYRKENSETLYECPDYHTAGKNSCFFNKNNTSIWVNYNISVVATNALGSTFSDPMDIDVAYIVKPNPPEGLTVSVMEDKGWPFLRVSWGPPQKADTRSGWITLIYEIRVKLDEEDNWEMHLAGQQKMFNIFSLRSGGTYLVQVRCMPDHGFWSEWSSTSSIKVPEYFHREKSLWILITVFSVFILLILVWLLHMNSHSLKQCIFPPVPGPKIQGFDNQLIKNGKPDDIFGAMVVSDFPPTSLSPYEDLLVEYLEVYVAERDELMPEESKNLNDGCLNSESSTFDSDSGRGSCDSHTLLMDKCGEAKEDERQKNLERMGMEAQRNKKDWDGETLTCAQEDKVRPDMPGGRLMTRPSMFPPLPQYSSSPLTQQCSREESKEYYLSDSLLPRSSSTSSYVTQPDLSSKQALGLSYWELCSSNKQPHLLQPQTHQLQLRSHSDVNILTVSRKEAPAGLQTPGLRSTMNTGVQSVKEKERLFQSAVSCGGHIEGCPLRPQGEDYSKVKGVHRDNVLILQKDMMVEGRCLCEPMEMNGVRENRFTLSTVPIVPKPSTNIHSAVPIQDQTVLAVYGYVDTTMCPMPTY